MLLEDASVDAYDTARPLDLPYELHMRHLIKSHTVESLAWWRLDYSRDDVGRHDRPTGGRLSLRKIVRDTAELTDGKR